MDGELKLRFAGRWLPVDEEVAERWGLVTADAARHGAGVPVLDGLIAATALVHGMTVITRNTVDIHPTGALHMTDEGGVRVMEQLHTRLEMIPCRHCGTPFATEKQVAGLQGRTAVPDETLRTCPVCRRQETARCAGKVGLCAT